MDIDSLATKFINDLSVFDNKQRGSITFAVKKNYSEIVFLNTKKGFSLKEILGVINNKKLDGDVSHKAFYAAVARQTKQQNNVTLPASASSKDDRNLSFGAHEKIESKNVEPSEDVQLSDGWLHLLKNHPVMKKETIKRAINNGLTFEEAKNANEQGIRKFAEIANIYCMRKLN